MQMEEMAFLYLTTSDILFVHSDKIGLDERVGVKEVVIHVCF